MKKILYILIVVALANVTNICAQDLVQQPQWQMQSTSTMLGSGSQLPQAATEGVSVVGETTTSQNQTNGPRKVGWDDNIGDPGAVPVGNSMALFVMVGIYMILRIVNNKRKA